MHARMEKQTRKLVMVTTFTTITAIAIGVVIGWFSHVPESLPPWTTTYAKQIGDIEESVIQRYVSKVQTSSIEETLRYLTNEPHVATTDDDEELVKYINEIWTSQLDSSEIVSHDILLSFPSEDQANEPNVAEVYDSTGQLKFTTRTTEDVYDEYMAASEKIIPYFNAFAPVGDVTGQLVYANYGSVSDFAFLAAQGVELEGSIALTKYGQIGRGARTINGKMYGVAGVLVYSDPADYALEGDQGYPYDFSLPPSGVQRGYALSDFGDPSTPRYPSIKSAYRTPIDEITTFPVLPLQPIAYEDASSLIRMLSYNVSLIGDGWSTRLNNGTLNTGPGFSAGGKIRLRVNNKLRYATSKSVIGTIKGSTEPDDWVIYGNHRDSWVYGAVDPSSGTACMMETTAVLHDLRKSGWKPKRTIIFASWGAEEFGLIGSTEWAQEKAFLLSDRAVAYINVDIAVFANLSFYSRASPLMTSLLKMATEEIEDPVDSNKSVFDAWTDYYPGPRDGVPYVATLPANSDYAYFYNGLGITSADLSYRGNMSEARYQISPYPTYHTGYDTFDYMKRFVDPGFVAHATVCKISGAIMLRLADSLIIPFDLMAMVDLIEDQAETTLRNYGEYFSEDKRGYLTDAINLLKDNAITIGNYIEGDLDRANVLDIAAVNNRLRRFEKSFIEPLGLPGQINFKHIFGYHYGTNDGSFPSIAALLAGVSSPSREVLTNAEKQLAMITYRLLNAASMLEID